MATEEAKEKIEVVKKSNSGLTGHASAHTGKDTASASHAPSANSRNEAEASSTNNENAATDTAANKSKETMEPDSMYTLEEILAAYREVFTELEKQENEKVNQVVAQAKADYQSGNDSGDELMAKYQELAHLLENNANKTFHAYYQQLQANLEQNGYDVNEATPFKNEYEAKKHERLSLIYEELAQL